MHCFESVLRRLNQSGVRSGGQIGAHVLGGQGLSLKLDRLSESDHLLVILGAFGGHQGGFLLLPRINLILTLLLVNRHNLIKALQHVFQILFFILLFLLFHFTLLKVFNEKIHYFYNFFC
jgi:hypothetical protein